MRILILAVGSRGDTQPCVALGKGLRDRGHHVRVAAGKPYAPLVEQAGLEYAPIAIDPGEIVRSATGRQLVGGGSTLQTLRRFRRVAGPLARQVMADCHTAAEAGTDLVLAPHLGWMGHHVAQRHRVPHMIMRFSPGDPTTEFPSQLLYGRDLGALGNRISHHILEQALWHVLRSAINGARHTELGLPPVSLTSPMQQDRRARVPVLCAFSRHVVPRPADWPDHVHLTGYWTHDEQPDWAPPPALAAFLAAGPPPVFVGFGSLALEQSTDISTVVREGLRRAGVRGVVQGHGAGLADDRLLVIGDAPHAQLFPHMSVVIHHGGAGTTAAGLRAGVPTVIVCPRFSDQPFWGHRVAQLGAGPPPIRLEDLTAQRLATAIRAAMSTTGAEVVADLLRAEGGVGHACDLVEQGVIRQGIT